MPSPSLYQSIKSIKDSFNRRELETLFKKFQDYPKTGQGIMDFQKDHDLTMDQTEKFIKFTAKAQELMAAPKPQEFTTQDRVGPGGGQFTDYYNKGTLPGSVDPLSSVQTGLPPKQEKDSALQNKINSLMKNLGLSIEDATLVATGQIGPTTDPITGKTELLNKMDYFNKSPEKSLSQKLQNPAPEKEPYITPELAVKATGPGSWIKQKINNYVGGFSGDKMFFKDTAVAKQKLGIFNQTVKIALTNNPRFPIAEQKIIEKLLPNTESFFKDPKEAVLDLENLVEFLDYKIKSKQSSLDTGGLTKKQSQEYTDQINSINEVLGLLDTGKFQQSDVDMTQFSDEELDRIIQSGGQ